VTSNSGASTAPKGVCHVSRYSVTAEVLVMVTTTATSSLLPSVWRSAVTLTVTPAAACAAVSTVKDENAASVIAIRFLSMVDSC
jgi:hypothetical protein